MQERLTLQQLTEASIILKEQADVQKLTSGRGSGTPKDNTGHKVKRGDVYVDTTYDGYEEDQGGDPWADRRADFDPDYRDEWTD